MDHKQIYAGLTTPESLDFESILAEMEERGAKIVAAEISSIGLAQHRVEALDFRAALFTNLGRDHLDYHETAENYFAAKLRLFTELLPRSTHRNPVTVACGDDPFGKRLLDAVQGRKLSFGLAGSLDVHPIWAEIEASGIHTKIQACGREIEVESPLPGEINLLNILAAVAVAAALDIGTEAMIEGLKRCSGAPGRLERVPGPSEVTILVDYAHKPEALAGMLKSLRALGPRRLICVFGCGGDRDRGKRPIMGGIAGRLADLPILTSDNPRSEDPMAIILEVEKGLAGLGLRRLDSARPNQNIGYIVEPERRAAIALAIESAHPGDIVVIAGKGHEDYQLIGGRKLKFDDRQVIREIVAGA